ncbi:putative ubiquitin-like-conjugating enzyme ATG10 [Scophthalmus maximus]|uniref:Ubiquitin-like-conjugating enzyme ATG10 n=1 Tax=Scophthalmus maximus TaxID=52904 RepID=A0A2U9BL10_SCOMX|nr:putative ubiquitin-like-conjugating enzyme ATG10 [Scophthalmus maximus]
MTNCWLRIGCSKSSRRESVVSLTNEITGKVSAALTRSHNPEEKRSYWPDEWSGGVNKHDRGILSGLCVAPAGPGVKRHGDMSADSGDNRKAKLVKKMSWCMLEETFHSCCQLLLQQSEQLKDGWSWEPVQDSQEGFLRKTALRSLVINSSPVWDQSLPVASNDADSITVDIVDDDDEDDGVCMVSEDSSQVLKYEYHILYSCSYSTPVLYFRAFTLEGRSLSLEEVWSSIHPNFRLRLQDSPLHTISQQEHPLLGQPFFMLHPCRTEEFMRPVMQAAQDQHRPVNYVLTWLSVVAPLVGLDVPLKYFIQLHPEKERPEPPGFLPSRLPSNPNQEDRALCPTTSVCCPAIMSEPSTLLSVLKIEDAPAHQLSRTSLCDTDQALDLSRHRKSLTAALIVEKVNRVGPVHSALLLANSLLLPHCKGWAATAHLNSVCFLSWFLNCGTSSSSTAGQQKPFNPSVTD